MKKINQTKAQLFRALAESEAKLARLRARDADPLSNPSEAERAIRALYDIESFEQERFFAALLDSRQKILEIAEIARGTLGEVGVHPRDVFRRAIRMNAHAIIMAHNHPSGEEDPSESDMELTTRMLAAGRLVGIPVLDHLILTAGDCTSMASIGLLR